MVRTYYNKSILLYIFTIPQCASLLFPAGVASSYPVACFLPFLRADTSDRTHRREGKTAETGSRVKRGVSPHR